MIPKITKGNSHTDSRGTLLFNNEFDASVIKRFYIIENRDTSFIRAWQGHKIEQRWFSAIHGSFAIKLIKIEDWENPTKGFELFNFVLHADKMDILHLPKGYISSIQSLVEGSKLLVLSDYFMGEIQDEYRFDKDFFTVDY